MKWFALVFAAGVALAVAASPLASGSPRAASRTVIELQGFAGSGTFTYRDRNDSVSDAGSWANAGFSDGPLRFRNGQRYQSLTATTAFEGKEGTFRVRYRAIVVEASGSWLVATGTWSFAGGTEAYEGIRGAGRFASIVGGNQRRFTQFEGLATGGP